MIQAKVFDGIGHDWVSGPLRMGSSGGVASTRSVGQDRPIESVLDPTTSTNFTPYYLGASPALPGGGKYCLASTDQVRFISDPIRNMTAAEQDPNLPPPSPDVYDESMVVSNYVALTAAQCVPGKANFDQADLDVVSFDRTSAAAAAWRASFVEEAEATALVPEEGTDLRAGVTPVSPAGSPTTAWSVARPDGTTSALMSVGNATIIVTGAFDKESLPRLVSDLTPR